MCYSKLSLPPALLKAGNPCINPCTSKSLNLDQLLQTAVPLSKGAQGQIFKCKISSHQTLLLKKFPKTLSCDEVDSPFHREVNALTRLAHPNIPSLITTFESQNSHYLVREHIDGVDLLTFINSFSSQSNSISEELVRSIFKQLVSLINHCHSTGIYHCDIKLENIIINEGKIYLIDFGLATTSKITNSCCGTMKYTAPEVLLKKTHCSALQDIWSCGVVLYALCFGCLPFDSARNEDCFLMIIEKSNPSYPSSTNFSDNIFSLLRGLLNKDPQLRISIEDITSHPWFTNQYDSKKFAPSSPIFRRPIGARNPSMFNRVIKV